MAAIGIAFVARSGVVDQNVEFTLFGGDSLKDGLDLGDIAVVTGDGDSLSA
jgi:hypothetical protein